MVNTTSELVAKRESAMDRADRALDKAWPERIGDDFVREMRSAAAELESLADQLQASRGEPKEISRTFRYLGSVYADLAPALGKQMFEMAVRAYREAETLLEGDDDVLEHARLDFNFGNTLRQFDPNDIAKLEEAERRFIAAERVFSEHAPQYMASVKEALSSTRGLLKVAGVAGVVERSRRDMEELEGQLEAGGNVAEIAEKMQEIRERGGGAAGLFTSVQELIGELPESARRGEKFHKLTQEMDKLTSLVAGGDGPLDPGEREIMDLLKKKLDAETKAGRVTDARAETLSNLIDDFSKSLGGGDDIETLMKRVSDIRKKTAAQFESLHYMSHGIDSPPEGSRAAKLVELCWALRFFLIEEMNQRGKHEGESQVVFDLNVRSAKLDKRIYEAGRDDARAMAVDREVLRPFAVETRSFAARHHALLAKPVWAGGRMQTATSAVLFAGSASVRKKVGAACKNLGFELMSPPKGASIAASRWKQLQKAYISIFDLSAANARDRAAVAYELGIARMLGTPVLVLAKQDQVIPFDVDVEPVLLTGSRNDKAAIAEAMDAASVWTMPRSDSGAVLETLNEVLRRYPLPQTDTYIDQTLKQLQRLQEKPDPIAVGTALESLVSFLGKDAFMLMHPVWPPVYPDPEQIRLFHVMPFGPDWADDAAGNVEATCKKAGAQYVRGDRVKEASVIRSIWDEINRASHILADLTDFNANVALELGIAHTLGRPTLMVGRGDTVKRLFSMIAKLRFYPYGNAKSSRLDSLVANFLG